VGVAGYSIYQTEINLDDIIKTIKKNNTVGFVGLQGQHARPCMNKCVRSVVMRLECVLRTAGESQILLIDIFKPSAPLVGIVDN
jgi:hypothetical protein